MSISTKTRKSLWAKSGNRCALCRLELVQNENENDSVIIGQECHIVSGKKDGPRGDQPPITTDFDDEGNLLLLCANDHRRIDTQTEIYPVDKLLIIKKSHEEWVKNQLSIDPSSFTNDKLKIIALNKIKNGSELVKIIDGAHALSFDNDNLTSSDEIEIIPHLFDFLNDYTDSLEFMNFKEKAELGLSLNENIKDIEDLGFQLFGIKRNVKLKNENGESMGRWDIGSIVAVRKDNPGIVDEFLISERPNLYKFNI